MQVKIVWVVFSEVNKLGCVVLMRKLTMTNKYSGVGYGCKDKTPDQTTSSRIFYFFMYIVE